MVFKEMVTTERFYLFSVLMGDHYEVTEKEFFEVVGFDRQLVPMTYSDNFSRRNFYMDGDLVGYSIKSRI